MSNKRFYHKCMFIHCTNGKHNAMHLFRFPLHTNPCLETWIARAANPRLDRLSASSLRRCGICADHFDAESFVNPERTKLKSNAVPIALVEQAETAETFQVANMKRSLILSAQNTELPGPSHSAQPPRSASLIEMPAQRKFAKAPGMALPAQSSLGLYAVRTRQPAKYTYKACKRRNQSLHGQSRFEQDASLRCVDQVDANFHQVTQQDPLREQPQDQSHDHLLDHLHNFLQDQPQEHIRDHPQDHFKKQPQDQSHDDLHDHGPSSPGIALPAHSSLGLYAVHPPISLGPRMPHRPVHKSKQCALALRTRQPAKYTYKACKLRNQSLHGQSRYEQAAPLRCVDKADTNFYQVTKRNPLKEQPQNQAHDHLHDHLQNYLQDQPQEHIRDHSQDHFKKQPQDQSHDYLHGHLQNHLQDHPAVGTILATTVRTYNRQLKFENDDNPSNIIGWINADFSDSIIQAPSDDGNKKYQNNSTQTLPLVHELINTSTMREMKMKQKLRNCLLQKKQLRTENTTLRLQVRRLQQKLSRRKTNEPGRPPKEKVNVDDFLSLHGCINPTAIAMVKLQLHKSHTKFNQDEKDLAKKLYYHSAAAYTRLRKAGCNFPGESTVRKWITEYDIKPGFCEVIFTKVKNKLQELPAVERLCALKWDEMKVKEFEEYSTKFDCIEGLIDLGSQGRKNIKAGHVMVFCLDSINAKNPWRQPLCYFLTGTGMASETITLLVTECLQLLQKIGADVQVVTCDQCTSNQVSFHPAQKKNAPLKMSLQVNRENGEFDIDGKTYQATYDFPHLIKRLIAALRNHRKIYIGDQVIANLDDFVNTWEFDKCLSTSQLLSHITDAHFNPNAFEAMNVKRAFQILSQTFANAIRLAGQDANGLTSTTWNASADFAERMNLIIDTLNVYRLNSHKSSKQPLSSRHPQVKELLQQFVDWSKNWSLKPVVTQKDKGKRVPCMDGLTMTVRSILQTYDSIVDKHAGFELATGLCNQDSVEHLFSKLRQRGGHNPSPTSRMVRLGLRHILSTGYIHSSDKGNVICEESHSLITTASEVSKSFETSEPPDSQPVIDDENDDSGTLLEEAFDLIEPFDDDINDDISYEDNAIAYLAGYIARYVRKNSECDGCRHDMMKTLTEAETNTEFFIRQQEFENEDKDAPSVTKLIRPTKHFSDIIATQLKTYVDSWQRHWASIGLVDKLTNECIKTTNVLQSGWFDPRHSCYSHRVEATKFLMRLKIYAQTRKRNHDFKRRASRNPACSSKLKKIKGV